MFDEPGLVWAMAAAMLDACNVAVMHLVKQRTSTVNSSMYVS